MIGLAAAAFGYVALTGGFKPSYQSITTTTTTSTGTSSGCPQNPSFVNSFTDAAQVGVSLSGTTIYYRNQATKQTVTTAPTVAGTFDIVVTNTSYIPSIINNQVLTCNSNLLSTSLYALTNVIIIIFTNTGNHVLNGTAYTATASAASGEPINETSSTNTMNWPLRFVGTNLKSTGNQMVVYEGSSGNNVSSASLSGAIASGVGAPRGYTSKIAGSYVAWYLIPAQQNGGVWTSNLQVNPSGSNSVNGTQYLTVYNLQPFVDSLDGTINTGTALADSYNNAKYLSYQQFTWAEK